MDLSRYIAPQRIVPALTADTKEQAIRELVDNIFATGKSCFSEDITSDAIYERVIERENIQTTGLGNGIAFPHARIGKCNDLAVAVGISNKGLDFKSIDKQPCRVICLLISPANKPYLILQMTAGLLRCFADRQNLEKLISETSAENIADLLQSHSLPAAKSIVARELMRPIKKSVALETPIEETTQIMHLNKLDTLPVVDHDNVFRGEISCLKVFTYGIPDFFKQLQTVAFVKNLDPFEKYFKLRRGLKVKDLYDPTINTVAPDTTLMEIIFEMTTKNRSHLFVVERGRLLGTIDRFSIIDRILFF